MRNYLLIAGLAAAGLGWFGQAPNDRPMAIPDAAPGASPTAPRPMKDNVIAVHTGDETMQSAKKTGRSTLKRFRQLMAAGTAGTYTVKFPLTQNGATEHIWMQLTEDEGDGFVGLLANDPVNGTKYKMGDRMTVADAKVEDWMIRSEKAIWGGYTVRAMLDSMPKEQANKYRPLFRD